jgi:hypothetical protein
MTGVPDGPRYAAGPLPASITHAELARLLADLAERTGNRNAYFPALADFMFARAGQLRERAAGHEPRPLSELLAQFAELLEQARERRGWAVVLYSGECDEHIGLRCATEVVTEPGMTQAAAEQVQARVLPGFSPHVVPVTSPAMWDAGT